VHTFHHGCQFGFCEAKFVISGFSNSFSFFIFEKRNLAFFGQLAFYVDLADLKMILADFWALVDF